MHGGVPQAVDGAEAAAVVRRTHALEDQLLQVAKRYTQQVVGNGVMQVSQQVSEAADLVPLSCFRAWTVGLEPARDLEFLKHEAVDVDGRGAGGLGHTLDQREDEVLARIFHWVSWYCHAHPEQPAQAAVEQRVRSMWVRTDEHLCAVRGEGGLIVF